ncbi:hypothetical protein POVCU2_0024660 [Plasmodium ovale curtisi]|uniref:Uncharacterized protein n=1 Tax=Plasmodium ovale curtisi TaxID=864141 RepID=A0A1A8VXR2_PLAOA|nr:hypothetical protein POVCU2_0024660 [Plasmodium ovale curtisi]
MDAAIVLYVVVRYAAVHYVIGNGKDVSKEKFCVYMRECVASRIRGKYKINEIEKNTIIFDENYEQKHINTFLYNLRGLTVCSLLINSKRDTQFFTAREGCTKYCHRYGYIEIQRTPIDRFLTKAIYIYKEVFKGNYKLFRTEMTRIFADIVRDVRCFKDVRKEKEEVKTGTNGEPKQRNDAVAVITKG